MSDTTNTSKEVTKLIESHLPFAKRLASQFYRRRGFLGFEREDLESAAFLGLCEAAGRYDQTRGSNFQSYSYTRINGSMFDLMRNEGELSKAVFSRDATQTPNGHSESAGLKLVKRIRQSAKELVAFANAADGLAFSLVYVGDTSEVDVMYREEPTGAELIEKRDQRRWLRKLVEQLDDPDRSILQLHYFQGLKFSEIAFHFPDFTKSKVCRYHQRAIDKLRGLIERAMWREGLAGSAAQENGKVCSVGAA